MYVVHYVIRFQNLPKNIKEVEKYLMGINHKKVSLFSSPYTVQNTGIEYRSDDVTAS